MTMPLTSSLQVTDQQMNDFNILINMPLVRFDPTSAKYAVTNTVGKIMTRQMLQSLARFGAQGTVGTVFAQVLISKPEFLNSMTIDQSRLALMNYFMSMPPTYWQNLVKPQAFFNPNTTKKHLHHIINLK